MTNPPFPQQNVELPDCQENWEAMANRWQSPKPRAFWEGDGTTTGINQEYRFGSEVYNIGNGWTRIDYGARNDKSGFRCEISGAYLVSSTSLIFHSSTGRTDTELRINNVGYSLSLYSYDAGVLGNGHFMHKHVFPYVFQRGDIVSLVGLLLSGSSSLHEGVGWLRLWIWPWQ